MPKGVDRLPGPYLLFTADFDAPRGSEEELRDWLRGVWTGMHVDLDPTFRHCFQYASRVKDADSFAAYVMAHRLETTMPFNDYWPLGVPPPLPSLPLWLVGLTAIAAWAVVGYGLWWLLGAVHLAAADGFWRGLEIFLAAIIGLGAGLYAAYAMVIRAGRKPFPTAPNCDLRSILKGLYLQRQLIAKVQELRGLSQRELFDAWGTFLDEVKVDELEAPTQAPGVIQWTNP